MGSATISLLPSLHPPTDTYYPWAQPLYPSSPPSTHAQTLGSATISLLPSLHPHTDTYYPWAQPLYPSSPPSTHPQTLIIHGLSHYIPPTHTQTLGSATISLPPTHRHWAQPLYPSSPPSTHAQTLGSATISLLPSLHPHTDTGLSHYIPPPLPPPTDTYCPWAQPLYPSSPPSTHTQTLGSATISLLPSLHPQTLIVHGLSHYIPPPLPPPTHRHLLSMGSATISLLPSLHPRTDTAQLEPFRGLQPTGIISFHNVNCTGTETKLTHCQTTNHLNPQSATCTHQHSVGVYCAANPGMTHTHHQTDSYYNRTS